MLEVNWPPVSPRPGRHRRLNPPGALQKWKMERNKRRRKEKEIHSVLLCQVPSCLISGPSMESVPSVCVRVFKCCTERDVLCDCVCVVCVCGFLWPAVIYSESLPVRMPSGHCLCVSWVRACVRVRVFPVCAVMSITHTKKCTTVNHFKHLSVSIQMNNLQWSAGRVTIYFCALSLFFAVDFEVLSSVCGHAVFFTSSPHCNEYISC